MKNSLQQTRKAALAMTKTKSLKQLYTMPRVALSRIQHLHILQKSVLKFRVLGTMKIDKTIQ